MPVSGRLVDRWGARIMAGPLLAVLGLVGVVVAVSAQGLTSLSVGLFALGAASGAADVAINAVTGAAQSSTGRPVIARAHAGFSATVVVASLSTGAAQSAGLPLVAPFLVLAVGATAAAGVLLRTAPPRVRAARAVTVGREQGRVVPWPRLVLGGLCAITFAMENGHQSWSALFLTDVLGAGPAQAAAGPAVFAGVVAVARWTTAPLGGAHPVATLLGGSLVAGAGTAALAVAPSAGLGLLALAVAAAGTAVLFPTLLSVLNRRLTEDVRGAATSVVATVGYLGLIAGPVYVGVWADAADLPGAMLALAALALVLATLGPLGLTRLDLAPAGAAAERPGPTTSRPLPRIGPPSSAEEHPDPDSALSAPGRADT